MAKVRVGDLAKQMGIQDKDLVFKLQSLGVQVDDASSAIDHEIIMAILSGKKLATRPRNVIMREDKPQAEAGAKKKEIKPPRPIVKTVKKESAPAAAEPAPAAGSPTPIIAEFIEAAEQEAAEQERAALEAKATPKPRAKKVAPPAEPVVPVPPVDQPAAVEEVPAVTPPPVVHEPAPAAIPAAAAPAATPAHPPATSHPSHPPAQQRRPTGPTGPRAQMTPAARPNYQGQAPVRDTRFTRPAPSAAPGQRPTGQTSGYQGTRPQGAGTGTSFRPAGSRPPMGGTGTSGPRPAGTSFRPSGPRMGSGGGLMPAPPPAGPAGPTIRRKKAEHEDERPDKKKTTGKRGKRAPSVSEDDPNLFTKRSFSATAVLADDADIAVKEPTEGESSDDTTIDRRTPSSRRDARKQAAPISAKVLEFRRPEGKVTMSEGVTVKELADKLGVKANDLMKHLLMKKGLMLSINAPLGGDLAMEIAKELNIDVELVSFETALELESIERVSGKENSGSSPRGPVITVMGHVDHGKTSLLDVIRETNVAGGEAGGITQHIGAYQVEKRGRKIVFLDTPGHEAFTMMRARGAKVTDIVILVVAADDGVMPQTKEAIDHARAAKVPMIVAINKIDKPNANVERVRRELSEAGVLVEQWGGDVVSVEVSALKKQGIDELLEMILLTSDLLELKATPALPGRGVVLEAKKEVGRGIVATVLIHDGTLHIGDSFFSGATAGRVRAMSNGRGDRMKDAGPATPVLVTGFDDIPNAGDTFLVVDESSQARMIGEMRQAKARDVIAQGGNAKVSLEQLFQRMKDGTVKDLNVIVKTDVQGSAEVLSETLKKLSNDQVKINILHNSVGAVSTNDVLLASASDAIIVGFNVRPQRDAAELAEKEGVEIRLHTIIYELIDEMKLAMTGLLDPKMQEVFQGRAEVRNTFKVPKAGTIAGCHVSEGIINRNSGVRLLRDNRVIFEGKIASLRHFKNDVTEVRAGFECGIGIERFPDVKVGDIIEAFKIEKTAGVLNK